MTNAGNTDLIRPQRGKEVSSHTTSMGEGRLCGRGRGGEGVREMPLALVYFLTSVRSQDTVEAGVCVEVGEGRRLLSLLIPTCQHARELHDLCPYLTCD